MIEFSVDKYHIKVFVGEDGDFLEYYKKKAIFIDDKDLQNEGTEIHIIISNGFLDEEFSIIAFKTNPIGYAGFKPGIHFETESHIIYIGAGKVIKTFDLLQKKIIFEKTYGMGFWGWTKKDNYILQYEEIDFGVFNLKGEQLWDTYVSPPYDIEINDDSVTLKFDDLIETRLLSSGEKVTYNT
jgi:hypothetical protein